MKALLFLLSEFIWIKSEDVVWEAIFILKGMLNALKSFGKLVLTSDPIPRIFEHSDISSAPCEIRICLREKLLKLWNISFVL